MQHVNANVCLRTSTLRMQSVRVVRSYVSMGSSGFSSQAVKPITQISRIVINNIIYLRFIFRSPYVH